MKKFAIVSKNRSLYTAIITEAEKIGWKYAGADLQRRCHIENEYLIFWVDDDGCGFCFISTPMSRHTYINVYVLATDWEKALMALEKVIYEAVQEQDAKAKKPGKSKIPLDMPGLVYADQTSIALSMRKLAKDCDIPIENIQITY